MKVDDERHYASIWFSFKRTLVCSRDLTLGQGIDEKQSRPQMKNPAPAVASLECLPREIA